MLNKTGPFLGFTYNGTHSSEFNIVRVVNNNRIQNDLLPESADITQNVEGADGTLYYGTTYKKKEFTVNFAFDNMEEKDKKGMQAWLGDGEVHDLIFDEDEYNEDGTKELNPITYSAKVTGKATLSFIPFDKQGKTIYKGEGSIIFTCYYPFGRKKVVIENPGSEIKITNHGVRPIYPCFDG
jgi:phage-related protein